MIQPSVQKSQKCPDVITEVKFNGSLVSEESILLAKLLAGGSIVQSGN
jgi:hypothetical protein